MALSVAIVEPFAGPEVIRVLGALRSTSKLRVAGVGSALPALSTARKATVWVPCDRPLKVFGDVQSAKAAESSLHCSFAVSDAGSPSKAKVALSVAIVEPFAGPEVIRVLGGAASSTAPMSVPSEPSVFGTPG